MVARDAGFLVFIPINSGAPAAARMLRMAAILSLSSDQHSLAEHSDASFSDDSAVLARGRSDLNALGSFRW